MSEKLAAHYGAAAQPGADTVKIAQMEYFAKLAAAEGIDLRHCTQEQIDRAWDAVFGAKEASEGAPVEEEVPVKEASAEEELAAARAEFERIKEARAQEAQSDMLGKVIAHSLIAELAKMAADGKLPPGFGGKKKDGDGDGESGEGDGDGDSEKPDGEKDASALGTAMRAEKALHGAAAKARSAAGAAGHAAKNPGATAERVGKKLTEKATGVGTSNMKPSHAKGVAAGVAAAGAGAAGGAAAAAKKLRGEKKV
ncbi:MAG TPA: hypothetical protein VFS00_15635, partial [Polyangiaceae bacterium]|nr:hypothetical protein [Polyangiaceae bacterium]